MKKLTLSQLIDGYILHAQARHLSPNTIIDYSNTFRKLQAFYPEDPLAESITNTAIEIFLAAQTGLRKKTLLNYHTGLSSMWTWAVAERLVKEQIMNRVDRPRPEKTEILPFTDSDVRLIMGAIGKTQPYYRPGKRETVHSLPNAERTRAMLMLMLDTGLRASELCGLAIHDMDLRNQTVKLFGKGDKERTVPISPRTSQVIWRYLATRPDARINDPAFATERGRPIERYNLLHICNRVGDRAGVPNCHPHRFRHTFAIMYLRNGGDVFTLQKMLGHSTLEMVNTYLSIAQVDLASAHRRASPVEGLHL